MEERMANDRKPKSPIRKAAKESPPEKHAYPAPFTEQVRERKASTKSRDEIKKTSIRGKAH
jgi:hypothetical protein